MGRNKEAWDQMGLFRNLVYTFNIYNKNLRQIWEMLRFDETHRSNQRYVFFLPSITFLIILNKNSKK